MRHRTVALALGVAITATWEGVRLVDYYDPVGVPTACFGHTATAQVGKKRTIDECEAMLFSELREYQQSVLRHTKVPLNDNQLAAFTSFVYNLGESNYQSSTLLKKLNAGDYVGACKELPRWVYAKGVKWNGLVRRRAEEMKLCLKPVEKGFG